MASSAISVFPEAVGTAATRLSPSATPASTAASWGGYSSATPSASSASPTPAGSPESELGCITGEWAPTRFKPSERADGGVCASFLAGGLQFALRARRIAASPVEPRRVVERSREGLEQRLHLVVGVVARFDRGVERQTGVVRQ